MEALVHHRSNAHLYLWCSNLFLFTIRTRKMSIPQRTRECCCLCSSLSGKACRAGEGTEHQADEQGIDPALDLAHCYHSLLRIDGIQFDLCLPDGHSSRCRSIGRHECVCPGADGPLFDYRWVSLRSKRKGCPLPLTSLPTLSPSRLLSCRTERKQGESLSRSSA
jgi:hypothetical protein